MRKFVTFIIILIVAIQFGCADNPKPNITPPKLNITPDARAAIEVGRGLARPAITIALATKGIPGSTTSAVLAAIDPIIDQALAGDNLTLVLDQQKWPAMRAVLVTKVGKAIVDNAKINGVSVYDQPTAELLGGQFVDLLVAQVKAVLSKAGTAAPATTT